MLFAVAIGGYALAQQDGRPGAGRFFGQVWLDHVHFSAGGVALICGAFAMHRGILRRAVRWHRRLGKLYMLSVLLSGSAALLMATVSFAGDVTHFGFGSLGLLWLATSGAGLRAIKQRRIAQHRRWMIRSYSLCFAAATLRVQLPLLIAVFDEFPPAYRIVSWSCWVPNLIFAELWLRATSTSGRWIGFGAKPESDV